MKKERDSCKAMPSLKKQFNMTLKLSDKFLIESMKRRISALEIKLGQKNSEIDEFIYRNKALKQKIKDKDLEINFLKVELDVYINKIGAEN